MDEMSIVDIFTKLIFDAQSALDDSETITITLLSSEGGSEMLGSLSTPPPKSSSPIQFHSAEN